MDVSAGHGLLRFKVTDMCPSRDSTKASANQPLHVARRWTDHPTLADLETCLYHSTTIVINIISGCLLCGCSQAFLLEISFKWFPRYMDETAHWAAWPVTAEVAHACCI